MSKKEVTVKEDTLIRGLHIDANYSCFVISTKSTSGCYVFLGESMVTWRNKKRDKMSRSSVKIEF